VSRKLDAKMSEAANTLHSNQIPSAQASIAKGIVGGDTRA
jgi:hypothetical protein